MKILLLYLLSVLFLCFESQLIILSPSHLVNIIHNRQIEISYQEIGKQSDFYVIGQLYFDTSSPDGDACRPLEVLSSSPNEERSKILLAYKGTCPFAEKARNAQNAGASMLIIINKGDDLINDYIFPSDGKDINIPIAIINNSDGRTIENFYNYNPKMKIVAEVKFTPPKNKEIVDFKFFFSSSEPKAYELLIQITKYMNRFDNQINFEPIYVIHKNPYYSKDNQNSNNNK